MSAAKKIAAIRLAEAIEGKCPLRRKVPLLRQQWERFKESNLYTSLDPDTQRYYANGWRLVEDSPIARMRITEIRNSDVAAVSISGSASNINNARRTVRRLLNLAVTSGTISRCATIGLLQENERHVILDEQAEALILPHCSSLLADIIALMRDMGLRNASELYAMKVEDIDWNRMVYAVPESKTEAGRREVPLTDRPSRILLRICEGRKEGWVFPSRQKGKHITGGLVNKQFVKARRSAGLPESMVLYSGRHDCGTTLMEETGNLKGVMQWLGHADVKAALRYQRPRMEVMRAAMNRRGNKAAVLEFRAQSVAQR